jgi:formyl-CoA transferase
LEAQIFMLDFQAARWLISGEVPKQAGNDHPTGVPTGVFSTSDVQINIAAAGQGLWKRFCTAIDAPELASAPEFASPQLRSKNRKELNARIETITRANSSAHWIRILNEAGIPCGPINSIDQTFAEPQVQHLAIARPVKHPRLGDISVVGQPINMSAAPERPAVRATPEIGQHTAEVLAGLGYGAEAIADLRVRGVV